MAEHVVITGASRGIGLELAKRYVARGARVTGTVRSGAGLPAGITARALEVTDEAAVAAFGAGMTEAVDLLVCNAGVYLDRGRLGPGLHDSAKWAETLAVNVTGVFLTIDALLPALRRSKRPRIAIISSQMGSSARATGGAYAYRASKAAAASIALNLAHDLGPEGFAVGAYHPGWVRTDMGTEEADIDVAESASGLITLFDALSPGKPPGIVCWDGVVLPF